MKPVEINRILAIILGLAGLVLLSLSIMSGLTVIYDEINYARWESNMFSVALMLWSVAFVLGFLALVFQNERKSPYLMAASTMITSIGFVFPYLRFVRLGITYQAGSFLAYAMLGVVTLLFSTLLLAYTNVWKRLKSS